MLCILEINTGGFYHATASVLDLFDNVQESFLGQLGLTRRQTFLEYNLAPLSVRRDIAMLGLIFRCVTGRAHPDLAALFEPAAPTPHPYDTRRAANQHNRQLREDRLGTHPAMLQRSVFVIIRVWNRLTDDAVQSTSASASQRNLTETVREKWRAENDDWHQIFSPRRFIL